jgi:hypothetical protein
MFITAQNMFTEFLDGINKEHTGTVTPDEFNRLINWSQDECIKNKYTEAQLTQKRIDDLRIITCFGEILPNVGVTNPGEEVFDLPYDPVGFVTTVQNPNGDNHGYQFLLNCAFRIQYINDICGRTGISNPEASKPMKSDKKYAIAKDPYNKPTNDRLYHEVNGNTIRCYTGTESFGVYAVIDYIRYARKIQVPTPGANTDIPCELPLHVREEIVDIAIRKKLGIYESPRYQQKVAEDSQSIT